MSLHAVVSHKCLSTANCCYLVFRKTSIHQMSKHTVTPCAGQQAYGIIDFDVSPIYSPYSEFIISAQVCFLGRFTKFISFHIIQFSPHPLSSPTPQPSTDLLIRQKQNFAFSSFSSALANRWPDFLAARHLPLLALRETEPSPCHSRSNSAFEDLWKEDSVRECFQKANKGKSGEALAGVRHDVI